MRILFVCGLKGSICVCSLLYRIQHFYIGALALRGVFEQFSHFIL